MRKKGGGLQVDPALLRIGVLGDRWTHSRARVGMFGTAHNSLFAKHLFPKQLHPWSCFSPPLTNTWVGMKLKKVAYPSSLPHFSLPSMYEVVGEVILPNSFFKIAQLHLESYSWSCLKKTALLMKLSCAKQAIIMVHYMIITNFFCGHKTHSLWIQTCHVFTNVTLGRDAC